MEILNYTNLTFEELQTMVNNYKINYEQITSKILLIDDSELNWNNLIKPFLDLDMDYLCISKLQMKEFYPDEKIREICNDLDTELSQFLIEQTMRKDYFMKFSYYYNNLLNKDQLSDEQMKYINNMNDSFKKNGLYLDDNKYNRVKEIKLKLEELCNEFSLNVNNENTSFEFTLEELKGLTNKFLEERKLDDEKYKITLKYPDYIPIMEYCENRETRKKLCIAYNSRCMEENNNLIKEIFNLRKELAQLFDYENFSDFQLENKMARNTKTVLNFLEDIHFKIQNKLNSDLEELKELSIKDNITELELYDISYYSRIYKENKMQISKEEIKQYFSLDKVVKGMFNIYSKLLNYKFEENNNYNNTFWHQDVKLFNVYNFENKLIGYFYLDLYPREGKYSHAACFDIINKSEKTKPVAIMACNFPKNDNLQFDDVETLFHEFGHVMHHISSKCTLSDLSSFSCENDFVETPSQLFEEWCFVPNTLRMMANENIPDYVIEKIILSRKLLNGYHYARQLLFAFFDMDIHGENYNKDPKDLYNETFEKILKIKSLEDTNMIASFGHLFGGYEAGYYGYLWSLVYAKDLFTKFIGKELDSELGEKLKSEVLCYGGLRDSIDSLKEFLGREPNSDYFIESL
jgi:thimet oligopeptidase